MSEERIAISVFREISDVLFHSFLDTLWVGLYRIIFIEYAWCGVALSNDTKHTTALCGIS